MEPQFLPPQVWLALCVAVLKLCLGLILVLAVACACASCFGVGLLVIGRSFREDRELELRREGLDRLADAGLPHRPELGEHVMNVFYQVKADVGFVNPTLAELKVTERKVARAMREYDEYQFLHDDIALLQLDMAQLIVTPSEEEERVLRRFNNVGFANPASRAARFHAGDGWVDRPSLMTVISGRHSVRDWRDSHVYRPQAK